MGSEHQHIIRTAGPEDFEELVRLEQEGFTSEAFSRSQVRWLLTRARGTTMVAEIEGSIVGSAVVLWRKGGPAARLYSITIGKEHRGKGLGRELLEAAEEAAWEHGCTRMSLEVRTDNQAALGLYESSGYRHFRDLPGY